MTGDPVSSAARSVPFPPGSVLAGKYRVERLLGQGGMGWVVLATHLQLDQRVALKFMHESAATENRDAVARFLREARAAARIQSDHVARVSDVGTLESGAPYLVMEFLEGQDLDSLLQSRQRLPVELAIDYALQACEGLAEAHAAGIVHRDLKPANLFLARKSDGSVRVKLLDFGISKLAPAAGHASDDARTGTQTLMGSPLYMAPEQMRSTKNVDRRADIWSMGVILYEMLSGSSPFHGETLPEICARIIAEPPQQLRASVPGVPVGLEAVVMRCLEKDPTRRFPDVASLARSLASYGSPEARVAADRIARVSRASSPGLTEPISPAAESPPGPSPPHSAAHTARYFGTATSFVGARRSPAAALLALAGGAIAVVLVAAIVVRARHHDAQATNGESHDGLLAPTGTSGAAGPNGSPSNVGAGAATTTGDPVTVPTAAPPIASAIHGFEGAAAANTTGAMPAQAVPKPTSTGASIPAAPSSATATVATQSGSLTPSRVASPGHPAQKPKTAGSASAKPAPTSGFGGRD